jgi:hypothetical protein
MDFFCSMAGVFSIQDKQEKSGTASFTQTDGESAWEQSESEQIIPPSKSENQRFKVAPLACIANGQSLDAKF